MSNATFSNIESHLAGIPWAGPRVETPQGSFSLLGAVNSSDRPVDAPGKRAVKLVKFGYGDDRYLCCINEEGHEGWYTRYHWENMPGAFVLLNSEDRRAIEEEVLRALSRPRTGYSEHYMDMTRGR